MSETTPRPTTDTQMESRRETLVGLLRRPFVQAVLVVSVIAQVVTVRATLDGSSAVESQPAAELPAQTVTLDRAQTASGSNVQAAWLRNALERESQQLAAKYRGEGYNVPEQLAMQIGEAAAEYGIDPEIAFGLVRAESSFKTSATSPVGAVGLMQLMPRTASWMEPGITRSQLRDPETNLRVGFKYLRYLMDKYEGDQKLALLAYNRGPGTVDGALKRGRNPDNGYADFVQGKSNHGHTLYTR